MKKSIAVGGDAFVENSEGSRAFKAVSLYLPSRLLFFR